MIVDRAGRLCSPIATCPGRRFLKHRAGCFTTAVFRRVTMEPDHSGAPLPAQLVNLWTTNSPRLAEAVRRRVPPILSAVLDADDILQAAFPDAVRRWPAFELRQGTDPSPCGY